MIYFLIRFVIQSEAKNLGSIKWVLPRSFVAMLLWMTLSVNRYIIPNYLIDYLTN